MVCMTDSDPVPEQTTPATDRAKGNTTSDPVAAWTPEKIGIIQQLQKIFMPQAQRQRDELYRRQTRAGESEPQGLRFVHYTSAEAALSIINGKRLWMRNAVCMADYREVQHGFDILNNFFAGPTKMESFIKAVDDCV